MTLETHEESLLQAYGFVTIGVCSSHGHYRTYSQHSAPLICPHCKLDDNESVNTFVSPAT